MSPETDLLEKLSRLDELKAENPKYSDTYMNRLKEQMVLEYKAFYQEKEGARRGIFLKFNDSEEYRQWYMKDVPAALKKNYLEGNLLYRAGRMLEDMACRVRDELDDYCVFPVVEETAGETKRQYLLMPDGRALEM